MDDLVKDFQTEAARSIGQADVRPERAVSIMPAAIADLDGRSAGRPPQQADEAMIPSLSEALRVQMDAVLHDQAELLDETQKMMAAWTKRRHEAMEAGLQALRTFSNAEDIGEIAAAYDEWLTSSMSRIMADMAVARDGTLRLAGLAAKRKSGSRAAAIKVPVLARGTRSENPITKPLS